MSRAPGWLYLALGGLGLPGGLWTCHTLSVDHDPRAPDALGWMIVLFTIVGVTTLLPLFFGGLGLGKAWAAFSR